MVRVAHQRLWNGRGPFVPNPSIEKIFDHAPMESDVGHFIDIWGYAPGPIHKTHG
jgi:hypothetical protein